MKRSNGTSGRFATAVAVAAAFMLAAAAAPVPAEARAAQNGEDDQFNPWPISQKAQH